MTGSFAVREGGLRASLSEPEWRATWETAIETHARSGVLPRALHPLPDTDPGDRPDDQVRAAAEVACGAPVGVQVVTSRDRVGVVAALGLGRSSAATVTRAVGGGTRDLTVGRGVEVCAVDLGAAIRELRRLLPQPTEPDARSVLERHERHVVLPAELAATAGRALRAGDERTARQACALAGLAGVPPLLEALAEPTGTAGLSFRSPRGLRLQRLLATRVGWVELAPTTRGMSHRLLSHDELVRSWQAALSLAVTEAAS